MLSGTSSTAAVSGGPGGPEGSRREHSQVPPPHTHTHTHIYTYTHTSSCTHTLTHTQTHIHTYTQASNRIYTQTHKVTHITGSGRQFNTLTLFFLCKSTLRVFQQPKQTGICKYTQTRAHTHNNTHYKDYKAI